MGLEERGFAGSDLMAGRLPWDAEILHLEGFHLDFVGLNLVDSKGWPQIGVCLEGLVTSNKTWHSHLPFYLVLTPILMQEMDFFTFLFVLTSIFAEMPKFAIQACFSQPISYDEPAKLCSDNLSPKSQISEILALFSFPERGMG